MKSKKKTILLLILFIILIACILLAVFAGYVPVFGNLIAKSKISSYSGSDIRASYNWYEGKYSSVDGNIRYDLKNDTIEDLLLIESERESFNTKYQDFVLSSNKAYDGKLTLPKEIDLWIRLDADDVSQKYYKAYFFTVYDNFSGDEEQTKQRIQSILSDFLSFMKTSYSITSIQFIYANKDHGYTFSTDSKRKEIDLTEMGKILKKNDNVLNSLDYLEWKKEVK